MPMLAVTRSGPCISLITTANSSPPYRQRMSGSRMSPRSVAAIRSGLTSVDSGHFPARPADIAGMGTAGRCGLVAGQALLTVFVLAGCSMLGPSSSGTDAGPKPSPGPTGFLLLIGSPTVSPAPAAPAPAPTTPAAPPVPPPAPVVTTTTRSPDPCYGRLYEGKMDRLGVALSPGQAVVSWRNAGDPTVTVYRVATVSQNLVPGGKPAPVWVNVAPGTGCGMMSTTITGLRRGGDYVFWLDAVFTPGTLVGTPKDIMIGRSFGVRIP